jgi:hypothetical protein
LRIKKPAPRNIRSRSDKYANNVTKRGNVPVGRAVKHEEESRKINPMLIVMFLFLVIGSSIVSVLRIFTIKGKADPVDATD